MTQRKNLLFKPYTAVARYIRRHDEFWLSEHSGKPPVKMKSSEHSRPAGLPARVDFARCFNFAREEGLNRGKEAL